MTKIELKQLRQYYHSLLGQQKVIEEERGIYISAYPANVLIKELKEIDSSFPKLLPSFNPQEYYKVDEAGNLIYNRTGVRSYLSTAISRLKVAIDEPTQTPITELKEFSFISNTELRKILERDYLEIQRAYVSECWKSVIILSGGSIEAILMDLLLVNESSAKSSSQAPNKPDITKWDFSDLINVSVDLKLVSSGIEKLSHSLREYRNLVHPGREIRDKLTFDTEEAKIALEVLHILYRDLS
ncbi:MAG: hypothetical protein LHV68_08200 [Elusimicrobia bacterium]|nr:hypothetical protein [Candidatus Liberimonas magnetica]